MWRGVIKREKGEKESRATPCFQLEWLDKIMGAGDIAEVGNSGERKGFMWMVS